MGNILIKEEKKLNDNNLNEKYIQRSSNEELIKCKMNKKEENSIIREKHISGHMESVPIHKTLKIVDQMKRAVYKIENKNTCGTGFICIIPCPDKFHQLSVLFTCNHVINNDDLILGNKIKLKFTENQKIITIDKSRTIYTNEEEYDITIIELKDKDEFNINDLLEIDDDLFKDCQLNNVYENKSVYLIHYPRGKEANHSIDKIKNIDKDNITINHFCSTEDGSSEAPIINLDTYKVIGIHVGKNKKNEFNFGFIIKTPINEFNKLYFQKKKDFEEEEIINKKTFNNFNNKNNFLNFSNIIFKL